MTRQTMTGRCTVWLAVAVAAALVAGCASVSSHTPVEGGGSGGLGGRTPAGAVTTTASAVAERTPSRPDRDFWPLSLNMTTAADGWAVYVSHSPSATSSQPALLARTVDGARDWTDVTPGAARAMLATTFASEALDPVDTEHAYLAVSGATQDSSTAANPAAVFTTADGGRKWTESAPFTVDGPVIQVAFADARHGWLLVGAGNSASGAPLPWLYRTTDGGRHWTPAASAPPPGEGGGNDMCTVFGIAFPTATAGWVKVTCRSGDYLAESTDGGSTWTVQSVPALNTCSRQFLQCGLFGPELSDGMAYMTIAPINGRTSPSLLASANLGRSWQQVPLPAGSEQYPMVTFFGPDDGMLVPTASQQALGTVFYTTTDGGQTWTAVPQGTDFKQLGAAVGFATPEDGFSWTQAGDAAGNTPLPVYATTNSGRTWTSFTPEVTG
jgi:photosystem II stability/assembly factor-like uncharacterized protein